MTYAGISGRRLDKISVFLKYRTARDFCYACSEALKYWTVTYGCQDLPVTAALLQEFDRQPVGPGSDYSTVDVGTWICIMLNDTDQDDRPGSIKDNNLDNDPLEWERWLKVVLLSQLDPVAFKRLGGKYDK